MSCSSKTDNISDDFKIEEPFGAIPAGSIFFTTYQGSDSLGHYCFKAQFSPIKIIHPDIFMIPPESLIQGESYGLMISADGSNKIIVVAAVFNPKKTTLDSLIEQTLQAFKQESDQDVFELNLLDVGSGKNSDSFHENQMDNVDDLSSIAPETLHLKAKKELILSCGESSITLHSNGKIAIRGKYILNRATGVNRILGGSVQIN